jgi:hypothetical protein
MRKERPPRLQLIRVFLSLLAGFMAGLVGWTVVVMAALWGRGPAMSGRPPSLPLALQVVAFFGPAIVAGYWLFSSLKPSQH